MLPASQTGDECRVGSFRHTERFPATSKLEFTVHPDAEQNKICVTYRVEILPIFFDFEREDELVLSADVVDEQIVNSWVERKILQFVDSYLKLQEIDPYQQENLVTDPVCGMRINKTSVAGEAQYKGQTYYFCVEECRRSFLDDPQRYVKQL
ncbi:MAG: YHS domain-containing protein [Planctomycetes bacterium]|nr:YHS domain-containing protein [Planctomycetota bacterium]MBI3833416.1 YHS domain-containing protein [Planctomycetota bacterium]